MLLWLKRHLEVIHLGISSIAGVAALFIAFFAYKIDEKVQENAFKEARVSRSVALAQAFLSDAAIKDLAVAAHEIEIKYTMLYEEKNSSARIQSLQEQDQIMKLAQVNTIAERVNQTSEIRSRAISLMQHVGQMARCMGYQVQNGETSSPSMMLIDDALCHRDTLMILVGETLHDLYIVWRPLLTCDAFFNKSLRFDNSRVPLTFYPLSIYQRILRDYLHDLGIQNVFYSIGDVPSDVQASGHYRIIEFGPENYCQHYIDLLKLGA